MNTLDNKIIWITGAGKGIGAATAIALKETNAKLVLSSRKPGAQYTSMEYLPEDLIDFERVFYYPCNVSLPESVAFVHSNIKKDIGDVDILINNAGIAKFDTFENLTLEDYDEMMNTNTRGTFLTMKQVLPDMLKNESGIILNVLSAAVTKTFTNSSIYSATKAAVLAMSRSLREEVREKGIKLIDIMPGATNTEIWADDSRKEFGDRMLQDSEVAATIKSVLELSMIDRLSIEEILLKPKYGDL